MRATRNRSVNVSRNLQSATSKFCVSWGTGSKPTKIERAAWDELNPDATTDIRARFYQGNWKRHRKFFRTKREATAFALAIETELHNGDASALSLPLSARVMADECIRRLEPLGYTLKNAVDHFVAHLEATDRSINMGPLVDEYQTHKKRLGRSERTLKDNVHRLGLLEQSFGVVRAKNGAIEEPGRVVETIRAVEVDSWLASLALSPQSVNNYRAVAHAFFEYAKKRDYVSDNPVAKVEKIKIVDKPAAIFTPEDLQRLLKAANDDVLPALVIGAFAGLRMAEIFRLDWSEVHLDRGFIEVTAKKSKTARRRLVKIEPNLASWLKPFADRTGRVWRFSEPMWRVRMEPVRAAARITDWPQNGLRHSYGSYHLAKFSDAAKLALEMGHTTTREIFDHYRELVTSDSAIAFWSLRPEIQNS